jgi:hypothetical protein
LETGRHPNLPAGVLAQKLDKGEGEGEIEWVRRIKTRLQAAFDLTRERQARASEKNRERDTRQRVEPDWKPGDQLLLWEVSTSQTRLQKDILAMIGHEGSSVSTKLRDRWTGPYPCVRMEGNYAWIFKDGKEVRHNVNRLVKHHAWDEFHPDTAQGLLKKQADTKSVPKVAHKIEPNSIIVFPKERSDNDQLPFGVGRVLTVRSPKDISFQWLGNASFNPRGTFLPGWLDPKDRKFYFQRRPLAQSHAPYLNDVDEVTIGTGDVIAAGFHVLTAEQRISPPIREIVVNNPDVRYAWGRDPSLLFAPRKL